MSREQPADGWLDAIKFIGTAMDRDRIELALWRKYYPHRAVYISEEASAEAEGREPNYPPPIAIG